MKPKLKSVISGILVSSVFGIILLKTDWSTHGVMKGASVTSSPASVPRLPEEFDNAVSNRWAFRQVSRTWAEEPLARTAVEGFKRDRQWNWKRPIEFYGIVVDEQDQPIENAEVSFQWNEANRGTQSATAISSDGGYVTLLNRKGYVLLARAEKDGYYTTRLGNISLNYAEPWDLRFHQPDPNRPVILKLRKMGTPEPLIERRMLKFRDSAGDGAISIDLLGQRESEDEADLRIRMSHGPEMQIGGRRRFDWDVAVEAVHGGLIEYSYTEEFPFMAPDLGYESVFRIAMKSDSPEWDDSVSKRFYFRTRGGKHYGRMELRVAPFPENALPTVTLVEYYLNPAGSRNLEFSPNLEVSQKYYVPQN